MKPFERAIDAMIMPTAPLPPKIPTDTVGVRLLIYLLENKYAANPDSYLYIPKTVLTASRASLNVSADTLPTFFTIR